LSLQLIKPALAAFDTEADQIAVFSTQPK